MLRTPAGTPASTASSPKRSAVREVWLAGFHTTGLPQANAGPSFHDASSSGKFQGTIIPTTPTGPRTVDVNAVAKVLTASPRILAALPGDCPTTQLARGISTQTGSAAASHLSRG